MPDTTSPGADARPDPPTAPARSTSRTIIVAVLCLALAAAGYLIGGRMAGGGTAAATPLVTVPEPEVGEIVDLDPVNVNLADGHYLRVAVSLGLNQHAGIEAEGHDEPDAGGEFAAAPAADLVLSTFAGRTLAELASEPGREAARGELLDGIREYYGDEQVLTVFFTEFVMQ